MDTHLDIDGLPKVVCLECVDIISNFVNYSENVTKVQQKLQQEILEGVVMPCIKIEYLEEAHGLVEGDIEYIPEDFVPEEATVKIHATRKRTRDQSALTSKVSIKTVKTEKSLEIPQTPKPRVKREATAAKKVHRKRGPRRKRGEIIDDDSDNDPPTKEELVPDDEVSQSVSEDPVEKDELQGSTFGIKNKNAEQLELAIPNWYKNEDGTVQDIGLVGLSTWKDLKFVCEDCIIHCEFVDFMSYKNHMEVEHSIKENRVKGYLCELCPINVQVYTKALNHLTNHLPHLKHCCLICSQYFWNFNALKEHLKTLHPVESKPLYICEYCGHFSTQTSFRSHLGYFHIEISRKPISKLAGLPRVQQENQNFLNIGIENRHADGSITEQGLALISKKRWSDFKIVCNLCDEQYENIFQLLRHAKSVHSENKTAKAYKCTDCSTTKQFLTHTRFVRHVSDFHHKTLKYCCLKCPKIVWNFQALNRHYQLDHENDEVFICLTCGHYSLTNLDLKRHRKQHGTLKSREEGYYYRGRKTQVVAQQLNHRTLFEDVINGKKETNTLNVADYEKLSDGSITEDAIQRLYVKQWTSIPMNCIECAVECPSPFDLDEHYKNEHPDMKDSKDLKPSFICKTCPDNKFYFTVRSFQEHVIQHHDSTFSYSCIVCSKVHYDFIRLYDHYAVAHPNLPTVNYCLVCGKIKSDFTKLKKHTETHFGKWIERRKIERESKTDLEVFQCEPCNKTVVGLIKWQTHQRNVHVPKNSMCGHVCEVCGMKFSNMSSVRQHKRKHEDLKDEFTCELCDQKFKCKFRLKSHRKIHSNIRPFACETCGKSFKAKCVLVKHMVSHTGERNFACQHCQKRFAQKYDLVIHERLHTGEFTHVCPVEGCNERYPSWSNLSKHTKSKHKLNIASAKHKKFVKIHGNRAGEDDDEVSQ